MLMRRLVEQEAPDLAARGHRDPAEFQRDRHDEVVRHHRRQRDARDDHHRRRRREAAKECEQRDPSCRAHIGSVSTNMSGFEPAGSRLSRRSRSAARTALIRNRYSGKSHEAVRRCSSSTFSTTITWNSRGRQTTAAADEKRQRDPARAEHVGWLQQIRAAPRREDRRGPVGDAVDDHHADGDERDQLDDCLEARSP